MTGKTVGSRIREVHGLHMAIDTTGITMPPEQRKLRIKIMGE